MSETQSGADAAGELTEENVAEYLAEHNDFFERHPAALEHLMLKHASGSAVSLIERQVETLRSRNQQLQSRLTQLLETARENETRVRQINNLARMLIAARSAHQVATGLKTCMAQDFGVDDVFMGLRAEGQAEEGSPLHYLAENDPLVTENENFFRMGQVLCSPLTPEQENQMFSARTQTKPLRSGAFVPLGKPVTGGMLVLASCDADRFTPEKGTLFLELMADLVATALRDDLQDAG
ncbi:MAG: DUF484 family protein [Nevskiales bacterium]